MANEHHLIIGTSGSGKSTVGKLLAARYRSQGYAVLVLDPHQDEWEADFVTTDTERLMWTARRSRNCRVFVDESAEAVGRDNPDYNWLTTGARKWGHVSHMLAQEAAQIHPTVRKNCEVLYLFAAEQSSIELLPEKFKRHPCVWEAIDFRPGEFFAIHRWRGMFRGRIDFARRGGVFAPRIAELSEIPKISVDTKVGKR